MKIKRKNIEQQNICKSGRVLLYFSVYFLLFTFIIPTYAIDTVDVRPPLLTKSSYCRDFVINVSELRKFSINSDSLQLDLGIKEPPILYSALSDNISEIYANTFKPGETNYEFSFRLSATDPFKDAKGYFAVYDVNKHVSYDSIIYKAEKLQISPGHLAFGSVFVGQQSDLSSQVININESAVLIKSIYLKYGKLFNLESVPSNFLLDTGGILKLFITYKPISDEYDTSPFDVDSLIVETNCLRYTMPISGKGVKAGIIVEDFDFDAVEVGKTLCLGPETNRFLRIFNPGTGRLFIKGYYKLSDESAFQINNPTNPNVDDLDINPLNEKFISGICFSPQYSGEFNEPLIFKNNANEGPDSIAYLKGIAFNPGPYFYSNNFGRVRVGDTKKSLISVRNSGRTPAIISGFEFFNFTTDFKILHKESIPELKSATPIILYPDIPQNSDKLTEILVMVEFSPRSENYKEVKIVPIFEEGSVYKTGSVFNYVRGYGFLPQISATGYQFVGQSIVNVLHKDTGRVIIRSVSTSSDLRIKSIKVTPIAPTGIDDFKFLHHFPIDTLIKTDYPLVLPIIFIPRDAGERRIKVEIISDAYQGSENSVYDTTIVYVSGNGFNKVLFAEPLSFDGVNHCSEHIGYIKIKNISDTTDAFITKIIELSGDTLAFRIDTDTIDNNFVIIPPRDSVFVRVIFTPETFTKNEFNILVKIFSDVDTSTGFIKAFTKRYSSVLSLPTLTEITPGAILRYNPPRSYDKDFALIGDFSDVKDVGITSFTVEIKYLKKELQFNNKIFKGTLLENWDYVSSRIYQIDNDTEILEIKASGSQALDGKKGTMLIPEFIVLLSDSSTIYADLSYATFDNADNCIDLKKINGEVSLSYCGDQVRKIIISQNIFDISAKGQNPALDGFVSLDYSLPYDSFTQITVYNSYGEVVHKVAEGILGRGEYSNIFSTKSLSSGLYFVRMLSGPFTKTIQISILK